MVYSYRRRNLTNECNKVGEVSLCSYNEYVTSMKTEHLDFITFCVGSLAGALHWSASRVYGALRSTGLLTGYIGSWQL